MTRDYGVRTIEPNLPLGWAAMVGLVLIALAMVPVGMAQQRQDRQASIAEARAWMTPGPPCPVVSRLTDIGFLPSLRTIRFDGIRFGRAYSYMMCSDIADDGGRGQGVVSVCRLYDPMVVDVTTPKTHVIFFTRTRPATITIDHGQPSCVLNPSRSIYDEG